MKILLEQNFSRILILSAILGILFLVLSGESPLTKRNDTVSVHAQEVIARCADTPYRPSCYDEEIPKLMRVIELTEVFNVVRAIQAEDQNYGYCHVLGHTLGALEVAKDPEQWMHVLGSSPSDGLCANGFMHGALIERFSSEDQWTLTDTQIEEAIPDLAVACEPRPGFDPSPLDKAICYHGIGHLTMYMTDANIPNSLSICGRVIAMSSSDGFRDVCYEGVFMQLFQPLEPEDEDLIAGITVTKENRASFCNQFATDAQKKACNVESWPVVRDEIKTPEGLVAFCEQFFDARTQSLCFQMLFHTVGQGENFNVARITEFCSGVETSYRGQCFMNSALSMVQADPLFIKRATSLCGSQTGGVQEECFVGLAEFGAYRFNRGSPHFDALCSSIPSPWQDRCWSGARS